MKLIVAGATSLLGTEIARIEGDRYYIMLLELISRGYRLYMAIARETGCGCKPPCALLRLELDKYHHAPTDIEALVAST